MEVRQLASAPIRVWHRRSSGALMATCSLGINRLSSYAGAEQLATSQISVGLVKGFAYASAVVTCPFLSTFKTAGVSLGVSLSKPKAKMSNFSAQFRITQLLETMNKWVKWGQQIPGTNGLCPMGL